MALPIINRALTTASLRAASSSWCFAITVVTASPMANVASRSALNLTRNFIDGCRVVRALAYWIVDRTA